ncbi:MAG: radical SAM protein [candidate division Zixibacteria bacterium]|nr:radical SAM protein [candidate division Zixibacteria bacterium]
MTGYKFYPQSVVWEITFACNMRCLHCGTSAGKARPDELTTAEALALIDELAALECEVINLSGGEPLLRKDWRQLAERIKHHNMYLHIISNGYLVDDEIVADFKRLQFDNVGISFDGTQKTHDYIRRTPGSHDRAYAAMKRLAEAKVPFCAVTQVSNLNLGEIDDIRRELLEVGCKSWRIQMTTATGRMPKDLTLTLDNYPSFIDKLLAYGKDESQIQIDVGENIGYFGCKGTELVGGQPYLGCFAGTRVLGIESDGKIKGCLSMPEEFVEGNIRDSSLTAIWNDPDKFAYNRKFTRETARGECYDCQFLPLCRGGCATTSVGASGHRADNPYCIYRIERRQGIEPTITPLMEKLLDQFKEPAGPTEKR